jgi:hypothetical protein
MSRRMSRILLAFGLWLLAPVPVVVFGSGWVPASELAVLALASAAVWITEGGGGVVPLLVLLFGTQSLLFAGLWWLVSGLVARALTKRPPATVTLATVGLLAAAVLAVIALPVYDDPFGALPEAVATSPDNPIEPLADLPLHPPASIRTSAELPTPPLPFERTEDRESCSAFDANRLLFWGDTHVHTAFSFDAWGQGTRNRPADAYRFARGESLGIQPYDDDGRPIRTVQLGRALDFTMVSDHAELLGEARICSTPRLPGHDSIVCRITRRWPMLGYGIVNSQTLDDADPIRYSFCGEQADHCREVARIPWQETQEAAEQAYDRTSACAFTSFVGFEWSGNPDSEMIHRNVLFRNEVVPQTLSNYIDDRTGEALWRWLDDECVGDPGRCDVLVIPHNSNLSAGRLFSITQDDGEPLSAELAQVRGRLEVLLEVTQHKGDSECRGFGTDELCNFETLEFAKMRESATPWSQTPPPPLSYAREILGEGLVQQAKLGVNPFRLGLIGATDTHLGTPGLAQEKTFVGHAAGVASSRLKVPPLPDNIVMNPGGLQAVWAEENSRDALFAAMRRRETYGTSGPRITARFFGGWDLDANMCAEGDFVDQGYARGVPMGGNLPPVSSHAPVFAVSAMQDLGTAQSPGTALQRVQIIKVHEKDGSYQTQVYEIAGNPENGAGVDLDSCTPVGSGSSALCGVWTDPDFDPDHGALYYARVVENPSCRWSTWACNERGVDCTDPATYRGGLAPCCDPAVPKTIQERAWTSPIWYTPN